MYTIDTVFYGNSVKAWLVALTGAVIVFFVTEVLLLFIARRSKVTGDNEISPINNFIADLLGFKTNIIFVLIMSVYAGSLVLDLPEKAAHFARGMAVVAFALQVGLWGNKAIKYFITQRREWMKEEDPDSISAYGVISFLSKVAMWSLISLVILSNLGINITALIASLGIVGIAVALSIQNILGDLFASVSIVLDKPFVVGDSIAVGDYSGKVEYIGIKTTRIRSHSGEQIILPNSDLLGSGIRNYKMMSERRVIFSIGVTYQTQYDKLKHIPLMISKIIENVDKTRFARAHFKEYNESALIFEIAYYVLVPDFDVYMDVQQNINLRIFERFQAEGIDFAYPTRTVYQIDAAAN